MKKNEMLCKEEVRKLLGLSSRTIDNYLKKGVLPFVKYGRLVRIRREHVENMLANGWSLK
jgi:excisionase family DNA binding protein